MTITSLTDTDGKHVDALSDQSGIQFTQVSELDKIDWFARVAMGIVPGATPFLMTSTRDALPSGGIVTLWNSPNSYIHNKIATKIDIVSDSLDDAAGGIGAILIGIDGVDGNGDSISELVEMTGQTIVQTQQLFLHKNGSAVILAGTNLFNKGQITFTINGDIVGTMRPDIGEVFEGVVSLPNGHKMLLSGVSIGVGKNNTARLWIQNIFSVDGGATFAARRTGPVLQVYQSTELVPYPFITGLIGPRLTTAIEAENTEAGTPSVTSVINGIFIDNNFL